jgi:Skp family chaperone for outer membrane proteins
MTRNTSALPPGRGSEVARRLIAAAALAVAAATGAAMGTGAAAQPFTAAQPPAGAQAHAILVVDLDRAVRESRAASELREMEIRERRALQERFDALKDAFEAEEAELVALKETLDRDAFDERVVSFDTRVRQTRRETQEEAAALQARFANAQRALYERTQPLVRALMAERGAAVALDRKAVLAFATDQDVTDALIERLNAAQPSAAPLIEAAEAMGQQGLFGAP